MQNPIEDTSDIYVTSVQNHTLTLAASELRGNLDTTLLRLLRDEVGNQCTRHGYIDRDSIEIVKRSIGTVNTVSLNGSLRYDIIYRASVCNPLDGTLLYCTVVNTNKMGILAERSPLSIVLARQHSDDEAIFNSVKEGDQIQVKIIGKRFELHDEQITAIGQLC